MSDVAIDIQGLFIRAGERIILSDISCSLPKGEFIGILGPNGAGKTTLLRAITGFIPTKNGQIKLSGTPLSSLTPIQRALKMAFLPQNLDTPFHFKVLDIVTMGRYAYGSSGQEARKLATKALDRCGIGHLSERSFTSLSGGERNLALLARCLCQDSPIFLLDEAASNLDIRRKIDVFELLRWEVREKGRTVVIVIHDINLASLYLDRLIFIKDGKIACHGTVKQVIEAKYLTRVFETRTIVMNHPECDRPAVLFSRRSTTDEQRPKGGLSHV